MRFLGPGWWEKRSGRSGPLSFFSLTRSTPPRPLWRARAKPAQPGARRATLAGRQADAATVFDLRSCHFSDAWPGRVFRPQMWSDVEVFEWFEAD